MAAGFPKLALRGEQVYMRLNSVLKACSLLWGAGSEEGQDAGVREPMLAEAGPWDSWPAGPAAREKSSEVTATGLSKLEGREMSGNWGRGTSKSVRKHG